MLSRIFGRASPASAPASKPPKPRRRNARVEARVRDRIAGVTPGSRTEVPCSSGVVDIVTPREIVEVKRAQLWKAAMGQVLAYSADFPGKTPRVHLFGPDVEHYRVAAVTCERFGVRLTASDGSGKEVNVWGGASREDGHSDRVVAGVTGRVLRGQVGGEAAEPGRVERPGQADKGSAV